MKCTGHIPLEYQMIILDIRIMMACKAQDQDQAALLYCCLNEMLGEYLRQNFCS